MRKYARSLVLLIAFGLVTVSSAAAAASSGKSELTALENKLRHELVMLPFLSVFDNLQFHVEGSHVTLGGQVARPSLKRSAERVVARIEGVSSVDNQIETLPTSRHDDLIRLGVLRAIYSHPVLDRYGLGSQPGIRIIVKNGDVTLEGVVAREMEKNVAFLQANSVAGVFSVTNNLHVEIPTEG